MRNTGNKSRLFLLGLALVLTLAGMAGLPARAQIVIDSSQSAGSVPIFAGSGLDGYYYYFPNDQIGSLSDGDALVAGSGGPTGTFSTTNVCYPDCLGGAFDTGSGGLETFTNGNATNFNYLVPIDQVPTNFFQTVLNINGYLAITAPGTYSFSITSDDGSSLTIGNTVIATDDGIHGNQTASNTVTFQAAGLYAIALDYFQNGGGAALSLTATDSVSQSCLLGCYDDNSNLQPNSLFYSDGQIQGAPAPEIGGGWLSLACLAAIGTGGLIRRHRQLGQI
jgi:hypothetical protein